MKMALSGLILSIILCGQVFAAQPTEKITNEMIYLKLLEIEKRQAVLEVQFREFKTSVDRRFQQVDKRFEELREDMNKRFEQVDKRFEELREDMNKRFDQLYTFLWIVTGIFSALVAVVIGFALWDSEPPSAGHAKRLWKKWKNYTA